MLSAFERPRVRVTVGLACALLGACGGPVAIGPKSPAVEAPETNVSLRLVESPVLADASSTIKVRWRVCLPNPNAMCDVADRSVELVFEGKTTARVRVAKPLPGPCEHQATSGQLGSLLCYNAHAYTRYWVEISRPTPTAVEVWLKEQAVAIERFGEEDQDKVADRDPDPPVPPAHRRQLARISIPATASVVEELEFECNQ